MNFKNFNFKKASAILKGINVVFLLTAWVWVWVGYGLIDWKHFFISSTLTCGMEIMFIILLTYVFGGIAIQATFYEPVINVYLAMIFVASSASCFFIYHGHIGDQHDHGTITTLLVTAFVLMASFVAFCADIFFSIVNGRAFKNAPVNQAPQSAGPTFNNIIPSQTPHYAPSACPPPTPSQMNNAQDIYIYTSPPANAPNVGTLQQPIGSQASQPHQPHETQIPQPTGSPLRANTH